MDREVGKIWRRGLGTETYKAEEQTRLMHHARPMLLGTHAIKTPRSTCFSLCVDTPTFPKHPPAP